MLHSKRVAWYEAAYNHIRADLIPEAPAHVTLTVGFPTRKRSGQDLCVGECCFDIMKDHGEGFGGENIITLHPILGDDVVRALATLVHEMIHHSLEPEAKHGRKFQEVAKRVGLCKPWTATQPDETLQRALTGIAVAVNEELGYEVTGVYVPHPPRPRKPSTSVKHKCACPTPRTLVLTKHQMEKGAIACGECDSRFYPMEAVAVSTGATAEG